MDHMKESKSQKLLSLARETSEMLLMLSLGKVSHLEPSIILARTYRRLSIIKSFFEGDRQLCIVKRHWTAKMMSLHLKLVSKFFGWGQGAKIHE